MGLFRRGTKLLKLGSGLRDCCCRPENPEECWCPSWCSYYVIAEGRNSDTDPDSVQYPGEFPRLCPPKTLVFREQCEEGFLGDANVGPPCTDFQGIANNPTESRDELTIGQNLRSRPLNPLKDNYIGASMYSVRRGYVIGTPLTLPSTEMSYVFDLNLGVTCELNVNTAEPSWFLFCQYSFSINETSLVALPLGIRRTVKARNIVGRVGVSFQGGGVLLDPAHSEDCEAAGRRFCSTYHETANTLEKHLRDLSITVAPTGVTVSSDGLEQSLDWEYSYDQSTCFVNEPATFLGPQPCNEAPLPLPDEDSFYIKEIQIKKKPFCIAGNCDCTESLTGMTVNFEGKTFTYGSLQTITDGVDTWEETIPGLFRRTTRETCDGTYVAAVRIAEVFCETVDGEDFWTVYLDSECYERDEATCPASADARRIMQWTGVFTCGEDGKPGGTPHSATDAADPPDLDSNTTLGTPAAECAGDLDLPAISFG